jgi:hypothetical protein
MTPSSSQWLQRAAAIRELITVSRSAWVQGELRELARYCELHAVELIRNRKSAQIIPFRQNLESVRAEPADNAS